MPAVHSRHTRDDDDDDDDFEAELCHRRMRRVHAATAARRRRVVYGPKGRARLMVRALRGTGLERVTLRF